MSSKALLLLFLCTLPFLTLTQHCISDVTPIEKTGLMWLTPNFVPPWLLYPESKLYESQCLTNYLETMFDSPLNNLTNITIKEISNEFTLRKCPFYLHGGLIRDILRGDPSHDVDVSVACPVEKIYEICKSLLKETEEKHNVSLCFVNEYGYMFIGRRFIDIGIEGHYWEDSFFHQENQEFTPNILYYDALNSMIIDLSTGVEDIQNHQIRIPVKEKFWDRWLFTANTTVKNENMPLFAKWIVLKKVCRYWKLKAKGYMDYDNKTKAFLIGKIQSLWNSKAYPMNYAFKMFLCQALGGEVLTNNNTCFVEGEIPSEKITFCQKYLHEVYLDLRVVENGRIFNEINEMVKGTLCYNNYIFVMSYSSSSLAAFTMIYAVFIFILLLL